MLFAGDQLVSLGSLLDRKTVGDQRGNVQPPARQQVDKGFQVATLRPAHVTDRIILTAFFVSRVVAPRAVGTGVQEGQLFFVINLARQLQSNRADRDHARPVAGDHACQLDRVGGGGIGADQHGIAAPAA